MRTILYALVALVVAGGFAVPVANAQEQAGERPNVVAFSEWKCPIGNLGEALEITEAISRPIHQELIDEGMITGWSVLTHLYGDEWNLIFVTHAKDLESAMASGREFNRRVGEMDLGDQGGRFTELCPYHRDNVYTIQHGNAAGQM